MKKFIFAAVIVGLVAAFGLLSKNTLFAKPQDNSLFEATFDAAEPDSLTPTEKPRKHYKEISHPTPNYDRERRNTVEGVILHHTAEPTIQRSLGVLTSRQKGVGTHCVIDLDGTRYIMCKPEVVTYHAGKSILNGKESCNNFTIGIEFQGNTLEKPLTTDQINSAVEYLLPIMAKYRIPLSNVVTHEMVRNAYKRKYPNKKCYGKVDITPTEYRRVMKALKAALNSSKQ